MGISFRQVALPTACAVVTLLAACGGGGGGGSATATVTLTPAGALNFDAAKDVFVPATLLGAEGTGLWDGGNGGSDSGSADAAGSAGDGEFVKLSINFPKAGGNGTLNWTILRSAYGQDNKVGTPMTLVPDANVAGGYKVTSGGGLNQSNIYVSKYGQITGSLPLPVGTGGTIADSLFVGARIKDLPTPSLSTYAGTYSYVAFGADKTTGKNPDIETGVVFLTSSGKGRICPTPSNAILVTYSPTCTDGEDIVAAFDTGTGSGSILRISQDPSLPNANGFQLDMIAVAKPYVSSANSSGMTFSGDFVFYNKANGFRTGAMYASRQDGSTLQPTDVLGAGNTPSYWNVTGKNVDTATGVSTPITRYIALIQSTVNGVTGVRRVVFDPATSSCSSGDADPFVAGSTQGAPGSLLAKINNTNGTFYYLGVAQTDVDTFAFRGDTAMGIGRRTTSSTVAGYFTNCQP